MPGGHASGAVDRTLRERILDRAHVPERRETGCAWTGFLPTLKLMSDSAASVGRVRLLVDVPELIRPVGLMRWREWGQPPGPIDPEWWIQATRREAGREGMPVTLVTQDDQGKVTGAVGLNDFDLPELRDRSPWIIGMIVASDRRGRGLGRVLVDGIEAIATAQGHQQLWVATERGAGFYERCGFVNAETLRVGPDLKYILVKRLGQRSV